MRDNEYGDFHDPTDWESLGRLMDEGPKDEH
jgi:hypothetical protein